MFCVLDYSVVGQWNTALDLTKLHYGSISRCCLLCVDSIELDDDQSDAESTDSATADIPLPSTSSTTGLSPTLDAIPLPKSPVHEKPVADNCAAVSSLENVGTTSKVDVVIKADEPSGVRSGGDAVHAKTSIGTITVLLNRKVGPRLSKASVFDVPDDNAKEVNRKLLKLRRLKRMKKNKDGQSEVESGAVTGRKALQQRISEWKEELLNDQNFKSKRHDSKGVFVSAADKELIGESKDTQSNAQDEGRAAEAKDAVVPASMASLIKTEAVDSKVLPSLKPDDSCMMKLYDSFMKVTCSNDAGQLDWPREMIDDTKLAPKLVYSCNPLYFSFRKLQLFSLLNGENTAEPKKRKHQRKHKKTRVEKTGNQKAGLKAAHQDANSLVGKKDKMDSSKTLKKDSRSQLHVNKEHTKITKNSLEHERRNKKTKKQTKSHTSNKHKLSVADDTSVKPVSGSHSQSIRPTEADDDTLRLSSIIKDTGKSRWDTSSESEPETTQRSENDWKTSKIMRNRVPARDAKIQQCSRDDRSQSQSFHSSSDSSARSRKRSRYLSASSSGSSYSRSSSSCRSSSYSCRRRHRLKYGSSRSSSSYTDTASDYSRSSRSYSRSRSISRRRRWHSRSYSRSARSRSSSVSCSPHRRHSGSQLRPRKARSAWRSQAALKRPTTATQQTKQKTQPSKESGNKSKTDTAVVTKNSSNGVKTTAAAPAEPADFADNSTEVKESEPVNTEESTAAVTDSAVEDVKSIPTPEEHMQSIPLPVPEHPSTAASNQSFIGPVLPSNHPLAHKQDIRIPRTAKFQRIGPNDPLVFRRLPPPPPPPASLTSHSQVGTSIVPPPRPPSPPADDMEDDIAGDEDPIPQMLDVTTLKPATFIPPEQDDQYWALRRQAELHARRQRIREETGMDIDDEEEDETVEAVPEEQLADQAYLDEAAMFSTTPVIHVPQQHLVGQPLSTSVAMMASSAGLVPVHMVSAGGGGLVGLEPSLVSLVHQGQTPTVLAVSQAAAALARAQEEAEAEAQFRQQMAAAQAIAAAQRQRAAELIRLLPSHVAVSAAGSPALATLRPAALSLQTVPVHALAGQQPHQQLIQLPTGRVVCVPNVVPSGVQVIAQPQAQPAPLVIGPNGTILRLIR